MSGSLESLQPGRLPEQERCLTETDNLNLNRLPDGSIPEQVRRDIFTNLITAAKEAAMPYAVSRVEHDSQNGSYMWLGKTAVENAASGYKFHEHPAALERVDVEVEEAKRAESTLRPGIAHIFISPRMSPKDADYEDAKRENLANEDSIRVSQALTDANGNIVKRKLESLLVRDVPLEAWTCLLEDESNPFGKSISIDDRESALSVMKVHDQLEAPAQTLPEGPVSIVEAVIPYIQNQAIRQSVKEQVELFRKNQQQMHQEALSIARRWLDFTVELADSLHEGDATLPIESFINRNQSIWGQEDLKTILAHQDGCHYTMSRELATVVARAKENFLWTRAGVAVDNQDVIKQLEPALAQKIRQDELRIRHDFYNVSPLMPPQATESQLDREIARHNVEVGGGCAGNSRTKFNSINGLTAIGTELDGENATTEGKEGWTWKKGVCVVKSCKTRPGQTEVGPCSVCKSCQAKYDRGEDPSKEPEPVEPPKFAGIVASVLHRLEESKQAA